MIGQAHIRQSLRKIEAFAFECRSVGESLSITPVVRLRCFGQARNIHDRYEKFDMVGIIKGFIEDKRPKRDSSRRTRTNERLIDNEPFIAENKGEPCAFDIQTSFLGPFLRSNENGYDDGFFIACCKSRKRPLSFSEAK